MTAGVARVRRAAAALALVLSPAAASAAVTGWAEARGSLFLEAARGRDPQAIGWTTLHLEGDRRLGRARLFASVRAEGISSGERGPLALDLGDRALRRSPLALRELYLRAPLGGGASVDLQLGRFLLGWGKTDGYSPADAFLPRDLSDPFADEKLPLWGARLLGQRGALRFELLGTATTTPWRLPVLTGRYVSFPVDGVSLVDGRGGAPHTGFAAARLLAQTGAGWDVGAWARAGVRPAPLLVFRADRARPDAAAGRAALPVDRRHAHEDAFGVEASRVLGPWVLRGEAAALFSRDRELGDAVVLALGAERAFGDATLLVTLAANLRDTPVDASLLLDRALLPLAVAAWTRVEPWGSWKLVWSAALEHGDGLVEAELACALTDLWTVTLGADVPYGPRSGPLGALDEARRIRLSLRRSW